MIRFLALVLLLPVLTGCDDRPETERSGASHRSSDSAYALLQQRGASPAAMGVDQYTSAHRFDDSRDGGRIELQRQVEDSASVELIRSHLRHIAQAFSQGDFRIPGFVHGRVDVPGTEIMSAKREVIRYRFQELPSGGELQISSSDPEAVAAIHKFLAFQRSDHRAAGHAAH